MLLDFFFSLSLFISFFVYVRVSVRSLPLPPSSTCHGASTSRAATHGSCEPDPADEVSWALGRRRGSFPLYCGSCTCRDAPAGAEDSPDEASVVYLLWSLLYLMRRPLPPLPVRPPVHLHLIAVFVAPVVVGLVFVLSLV